MRQRSDTWMIEVLKDMELYANKNDLGEIGRVLFLSRTVVSAELQEKPNTHANPVWWMENLVALLVAYCQAHRFYRTRDLLNEALLTADEETDEETGKEASLSAEGVILLRNGNAGSR